jgi:hypothetical protein
MNDSTNPYVVVGSPNYATPVLNMFGSQSPTQGQQANQQNKPGQPTNTQLSPFQQLLKFLQSQQGATNGPVNSFGVAGGTGGSLTNTGGMY